MILIVETLHVKLQMAIAVKPEVYIHYDSKTNIMIVGLHHFVV